MIAATTWREKHHEPASVKMWSEFQYLPFKLIIFLSRVSIMHFISLLVSGFQMRDKQALQYYCGKLISIASPKMYLLMVINPIFPTLECPLVSPL